MQRVTLTLFGKDRETQFEELLSADYTFQEALESLDRINWDFTDFTTQYLTHRFHSYPARFIPQIPKTFIKLFTDESDWILDPFCGCGTTCVEAFYNGRNSVGNDFNPLATLISKVKTTLIKQDDLRYLKREMTRVKEFIDLDREIIEKRIKNMPNRKISKIFDKEMINELETIREKILELKEERKLGLYDLARVALSSTIWSIVENGNIEDIFSTYFSKINFMSEVLTELEDKIKTQPTVNLINGDSRFLKVNSDSVDLIVTSPPYVNALDYYRIHMYNMLWLGMDFDLFRKHEIGGHSHFISNRFRLLSEYLGDMLRSMIEMNRVLKKGKLCVIVIGNSSLEYELIESYKHFIDFSKYIGFRHLKTIFRNIDTTKKYTSADIGKIDDEYIIVLQKEEDCDVQSSDEKFVYRLVKRQMEKFRIQIEKVQGTSIRGRKPTKERLLKNKDKIAAAIKTIREDIAIKD